MLTELFYLYEAGHTNPGHPECRFPETLIFNEGWLLRSVLSHWLEDARGSRFDFLPFPAGVTCYSEGQLYTPFGQGSLYERNTHVDGVVGEFSIPDSKSGIVLDSCFKYIAVFEAKIFGRISRGVKNASDYDQVSRTAACLINSILRAGEKHDYRAHLAVVYAEKNRYIRRSNFEDEHIERTIAKRLEDFADIEQPSRALQLFASGWQEVFHKLEVHFLTWEEVLEDIGDHGLRRFYDHCKGFA